MDTYEKIQKEVDKLLELEESKKVSIKEKLERFIIKIGITLNIIRLEDNED